MMVNTLFRILSIVLLGDDFGDDTDDIDDVEDDVDADDSSEESDGSDDVSFTGSSHNSYGKCTRGGCYCQAFEGFGDTCSNCGHSYGDHTW